MRVASWASSDPRDFAPKDSDWFTAPPTALAFARITRRVAFARLIESLVDVCGGAITPLLGPAFTELCSDACDAAVSLASSAVDGVDDVGARASKAAVSGSVAAAGTGKNKVVVGGGGGGAAGIKRSAPGDTTSVAAVAPAASGAVSAGGSATKRRRVTFAGLKESGGDADDDDDDDDDGDESDDGEKRSAIVTSAQKGAQQSPAAAPASTTPPTPTALALVSLEGLSKFHWTSSYPVSLHAPVAPFAPTVLTTPSPRGLLCASVGALRAIADADAAGDAAGGASSSLLSAAPRHGVGAAGAAASARSRLSSATRALSHLLAAPGAGDNAAGDVYINTYALPLTAALVRASRADVAWKPLQHALLALLRDDRAGVRRGAVECLDELYSTGGADALVLLPEALSALAETSHDPDARVEAATHKLVDMLQTASGEDLAAFLS